MGKFKSTSVSYHFDNPKQVYQVYIKDSSTFKWLGNAKTEVEAKQMVSLASKLLNAPFGPQMVGHLAKTIEQ